MKNENECTRLVIKPLTKEEKEMIKDARKITGKDRPTFYHDAIIEHANKISNGGKTDV